MKHLPNILTLSNLFCGSVASILVIKNPAYLNIAIILIVLSLVFDFFDGFVARAVKASGELGKQLDSLADVVSFGFFPGVIMMTMLSYSSPFYIPIENTDFFLYGEGIVHINILKYAGLLITLFSALRLAKFNIDEDQTYYFKGLNTPTNTIFILSLFYLQQNNGFELLYNPWVLLIITLISSYILVANLPLFALKFKNFTWKDNSLVFSFLLLSLLLVFIFKAIAIPLIITIYIIISIIFRNKIISNGTKTA